MDVVDEETLDNSQLPDTQKLDSDYGSFSCEIIDASPNENVWGRLFPIGFKLPYKDLIKANCSIGRGPECDVQITKDTVEPAILPLISKFQFKIELETDSSGSNLFCLYDLSSNGTFVNNNRIGKSNKIYLTHNDEISLSMPQNKAYLFVDPLALNSWLPLTERRNYSIITQLGQGAYGEVKLAVDKRNGHKRYAIKKISKNVLQIDNGKSYITNEIKILGRLNHGCTIKMEDVFENDEAVFIVLEYMPGGDLRQRIKRYNGLTEAATKFLFYQLMLAVKYLHDEGITHRDLKPENVLLLSAESNETLLKLTDFGLSKIVQSASTLKTVCGTLSYTAPEILLSRGCRAYTPQVDVWSLGCILYLCLTGEVPFDKRAPMPIQEQIVRGYYKRIAKNGENNISRDAIDLVEKMLVVNPLQRITVNDVLKHAWLQDKRMISKVEFMFRNVGKEELENVSPDFEHNNKKRRRIVCNNTMEL